MINIGKDEHKMSYEIKRKGTTKEKERIKC